MTPYARRAGVFLGLLIAICMGWVGYHFAYPIAQIVVPGLSKADARILSALAFGALGIAMGVANSHSSVRYR